MESESRVAQKLWIEENFSAVGVEQILEGAGGGRESNPDVNPDVLLVAAFAVI
jgi:hypothetical protein